MTKSNKSYAYIVHKYQFVYDCVYNMIDYMINIKKDQKDIKSRTKKM